MSGPDATGVMRRLRKIYPDRAAVRWWITLAVVLAIAMPSSWWLGRHGASVHAASPDAATSGTYIEALADPIERTVTLRGEVTTGNAPGVIASMGGRVTQQPSAGTVVRPGTVLARIDNVPVVVFAGATPEWRSMGIGSRGPDVAQLNENLRQQGLGAPTGDKYTKATAAAWKAFSASIGGDLVDSVSLGSVVFVDLGPDCSVGSATATQGAFIAPGAQLALLDCGDKAITVQVSNDVAADISEGMACHLGGDTGESGCQVGRKDTSVAGSTTIIIEGGAVQSLTQGSVAVVNIVVESSPPGTWVVPSASIIEGQDNIPSVRVRTEPEDKVVPVRVLLDAGGRVAVAGALKAGDFVWVPPAAP